ncbi:hypothetical protein E2C01_066346 [Portunus trituberculatus]|uniref:Uncharacterized protein n=1 Tax=Portunus trituberculatus TaxID=210409 RepID=A0A5B7HPI2_PORTR|nr:hypothetical protein [Portunus trituberculatus]
MTVPIPRDQSGGRLRLLGARLVWCINVTSSGSGIQYTTTRHATPRLPKDRGWRRGTHPHHPPYLPTHSIPRPFPGQTVTPDLPPSLIICASPPLLPSRLTSRQYPAIRHPSPLLLSTIRPPLAPSQSEHKAALSPGFPAWCRRIISRPYVVCGAI